MLSLSKLRHFHSYEPSKYLGSDGKDSGRAFAKKNGRRKIRRFLKSNALLDETETTERKECRSINTK